MILFQFVLGIPPVIGPPGGGAWLFA